MCAKRVLVALVGYLGYLQRRKQTSVNYLNSPKPPQKPNGSDFTESQTRSINRELLYCMVLYCIDGYSITAAVSGLGRALKIL